MPECMYALFIHVENITFSKIIQIQVLSSNYFIFYLLVLIIYYCWFFRKNNSQYYCIVYKHLCINKSEDIIIKITLKIINWHLSQHLWSSSKLQCYTPLKSERINFIILNWIVRETCKHPCFQIIKLFFQSISIILWWS